MTTAGAPPRTTYSVCSICDIGCQVRAEAEDGRLARILPHDNPFLARNICFKGTAAPQVHGHPDRLRTPLKRVGEWGADRWEEITHEQAIAEIAERLTATIDRYGPESWAVSTSGWNTQTAHGLDRRLMNLVGSPNWISGVAMCAGNTAAVNRLTYGWFPFPDLMSTNCIVLFGHNPRKHSWTPVHHLIEAARARGATVIVLDPRVSEQAERADLHLRLRAGTDAAMCLGWLKVIFDEGLHDRDFVRDWCVGVDELRARVDEYPLERVEAITGVDRELIAAAARAYATADGAVIPWTPVTDQQICSTSAIRLHSILRAVTGNLDVVGGEQLLAPHPGWVPEAELQLHDAITPEQRAKQLGYDTHPAYTYRTAEMLTGPMERVWGVRWMDQVMGCHMANPSEVFRAMDTGDPYPVKAFFAIGNNALLSYPNQHRVHRALRGQDLVVVQDLFMTPTAMLADYVLPGDAFSERPHVADTWGWGNRLALSEQVVDPGGEIRSTFALWRDLAHAMGHGERFPWATVEDVLDERLAPSGTTFAEFSATRIMDAPAPSFRKYRRTGFATPTGKVELRSSVLARLGFDPLPYFREGPAPDDRFPYRVFTGVREDPFFQTGQRNVGVLRRRSPSPKFFVHPDDAERDGLVDGQWARLETSTGAVVAKVSIRDSMLPGHLRVPHGWWYPELRGSAELAGAFVSSDAVLCPDDDEHLDLEQGTPHFKGFPGRLVPVDPPAGMSPITLEG
ncbi:molybdopterin-containing oxidoreductase family protein [Dermatobacter hominis]|uniref:molybdopterin-containing oxidoreductase family protein n=1 Tax=Dermatobacter hominis TaxID=2884263 RepID=UPI001D101F22|nr:molybdopterin-dependent oxidoreductase [Dermatobacter hominis]UDY35147.1 molybdopterin-dependent oxidoreductase [Dermatobacter hominis]